MEFVMYGLLIVVLSVVLCLSLVGLYDSIKANIGIKNSGKNSVNKIMERRKEWVERGIPQDKIIELDKLMCLYEGAVEYSKKMESRHG